MLKCRIERFTYCFVERVAEIWLADGNCTDMEGAIKYVMRIDTKAITIITWSGGKRDTVYMRIDGEWKAS